MSPCRLAFVAIPHFAVRIEEQRHPALRGRPLVIGGTLGGGAQQVVLDASEAACEQRIRVGMPIRQVHSLCREAAILTSDDVYYQQRFSALLDWALNVIPALEPARLGAFYADVSGLEPLYGSDNGILQALATLIPAGWRPAFGLGPNKFTAEMVALHGRGDRPPIVETAEARAFLAGLPIEELPIEAALLQKLIRLGLQRQGDLARLQPAAMAAQFGKAGRLAWEIASGRDPRPFTPRSTEEPIVERLALISPSDDAAVFLAYLNQLVRRMCARKERRGRGIRQLMLTAVIEGGGTWERSLTLKEPASLADPLYRIVRARLGQL